MTYRPSNPHGISFVPNASDPDRQWAMTLPEPIGSLVVVGKQWAFTSSTPPPGRLIGHRLALHGGQGLVKIKPLKQATGAQKLIELTARVDDGAWRIGLDVLSKRHAGKVLGSAVLSAAFILGRAFQLDGGPECVTSYRPDSYARHYLGDWRAFDGKSMAVIGDWSPPNKAARSRRWVWCLRDPKIANGETARVTGFGGLWDLEKGLALRRKQAEEAIAETKAAGS